MASFLRRKEALSRIYNSILHSNPSSLLRRQSFRSTFPSQSSNKYLFGVSAHRSFSKVPFLTIPFYLIYRIFFFFFLFQFPVFRFVLTLYVLALGRFYLGMFFSITLPISHPCKIYMELYCKSINRLIASYI